MFSSQSFQCKFMAKGEGLPRRRERERLRCSNDSKTLKDTKKLLKGERRRFKDNGGFLGLWNVGKIKQIDKKKRESWQCGKMYFIKLILFLKYFDEYNSFVLKIINHLNHVWHLNWPYFIRLCIVKWIRKNNVFKAFKLKTVLFTF